MEIVAFDRRFDRSSFSCGQPDLDDWLRTRAGQQERANNTRTFLAVEESRVIGYYATTACRHVGFEVVVVHAIDKDAVTFPRLKAFPVDLYIPETYSNPCPMGGAPAMSEAKSARINLRLNPEALETIRAAASVQQQDLTSFVLGAAVERARAVLAEDRLLRLTPLEVNQLERVLDSEPEIIPQLKAFIRRISDGSEAVSS